MRSLRRVRVPPGASYTLDVAYTYVHFSGDYSLPPRWGVRFLALDGSVIDQSSAHVFAPSSDADRTVSNDRADAAYRQVNNTVPAGSVFAEVYMQQPSVPEASALTYYFNLRLN